MPLALVLIGVLLLITGLRNTQGQLGGLLASDFSGAGNFWGYIAGIAIVGFAGRQPALKNASRLLIILILLVLLLSNQGFFAQFNAALTANITPASAPPIPVPTETQQAYSQVFGATGVPNVAGKAANAASQVAQGNFGGALSGIFDATVAGILGGM